MKVLNLLTNNILVTTMRRTGKLLTPKERRRTVRIAFYTLLSALVDVVGLALAVPVLMAANDPTLVDRGILLKFKQFVGIESYPSFMVFFASLLVVAFLLKNSFTLFASYLQSRFSYDVATSLARRQFMKYYNRGFSYFKSTNSADISNNVLNIPVFFVGGVLVSLINFMTEFAVLALIVTSIAIADIKLFAALLLVMLPSGFLIYGATKNRLQALGTEQLRLGMVTLQRINQAIFGYVDVRLTSTEEFFMNSYIKEQIDMNESLKKKHVINMVPSKALEVIGVLGILVIFVYGFYSANGGTSIFAYVTIFAAASSRVLPSFNRCLTAIMGIKNQLATIDILEEGTLPEKLEMLAKKPLTFQRDIEFRNLNFKFPDSEEMALRNFSMKVKKGSRIGIVGESGSGKTTLMNLLLRFLREDSGGIYVDGHLIGVEDIGSWRSKIGYVQQNVFLLDDTLRRNVAFGQSDEEIDETELLRAIDQASLSDFLKSLPNGLDSAVGEMGARLSGGQRQRIGIARALYFKSSVLVFDEATSALDTDTENAITDSIQRLDPSITVFVVAHRLTTLRHCDTIWELKEGKLAAIWTYPDLVQEKLLK